MALLDLNVYLFLGKLPTYTGFLKLPWCLRKNKLKMSFFVYWEEKLTLLYSNHFFVAQSFGSKMWYRKLCISQKWTTAKWECLKKSIVPKWTCLKKCIVSKWTFLKKNMSQKGHCSKGDMSQKEHYSKVGMSQKGIVPKWTCLKEGTLVKCACLKMVDS